MVLFHPSRHRPCGFVDRTNIASARTNARSMLECSTSGGGGIGINRDDGTMG